MPDLAAFSGGDVEAVTYAPQQVDSMGHSYLVGSGVTDPRNRFTAKFSRLINSAEANRGVAGSLLSSHANGGWQSALQNLLGSAADVKYLAARQACLIFTGVNDLNQFGAALGGFRDSARTVISRMRSAFVFENTDASIAYSGTDWTQTASTTENSGSSYRSTAVNGATYTITTPADLPARSTIAIGITGRFGGQGARHTFTVNGQPVGFIDAINGQASGYVGYVYRLRGINAGDVIVGTVSNVQTITSFDYWQVEAALPPTVLIGLQPYLVDYTAYGAGGAFGPPNDAGVDQLNGAWRSVAAEFDKSVITVDLSGIARQAGYFQADKLHPNELGHSYISDRLVAAWRLAPKLTSSTAPAKAGLRLPDGGLFATGGNSATVAWDPPSIVDGAVTSTTVTVTGAVLGDPATASFSLAIPAGAFMVAHVTAADTVTVTLFNKTGAALDLAAGTLRATVHKTATQKLAVLDSQGAIVAYMPGLPSIT